MNVNFIKNKFFITILLAAILQLITFVLSQWLIKVDQDIENKNYVIISNEMKLKDLYSHAYDIIPSLITFNAEHSMNSYMYSNFYRENEYEDSFQPIIENVNFYLNFIKDDFFIEDRTNLSEQLNNLEKKYDLIKDAKATEKIKLLDNSLFDIKNNLASLYIALSKKNNELNFQQNTLKNKRLIINVSLIITQILNLLFLSFFLFLVLSSNKEIKS